MRTEPFCRGLAAALLVLACGAALPALADTPVGPPPASAPIPATSDAVEHAESLKMAEDPSQRLTLAVMINGHGPYDFLVDTGSDRTVISRELATTLALADGHTVTMNEVTGSDNVSTVVIDHLAIGDRVIDHVEAPVLAAKDIGAVGMLGVDALHNLHLVMNFKTMRMSSAPSRSEPFDGHTVVVHGRSRFGQLVLVDSKVRGVQVFVILDSGSQVSIGNPALLKLLTGRETSRTPRITTEITSVSGRKATVELDQIAEANVGGVTIRNLPLAFAALPIFDHFDLGSEPALLLGMDVLSHCRRVSVDLRRREATFTLD
jgi:predicted aspartyl protease